MTIYLERNGDYTTCGHAWPGIPGKSNVYETDVKDAWNDSYFQQVRQDLLNGVKCENCKACWYRESKGLTSPRQEYNARYIDLVKDFKSYSEDLPIVLGLKSDNTCNLKCITCNQYQSSQHEKEVNQWKEQNVVLPQWLQFVEDNSKDIFYKGDYISENLDVLLKSKVKLEIQGGEPLISPVTHKILDYCIEHGYTDINLLVTVNLIGLTDKMLDKLSKFTDKSMWVSWDHIEAEKFKFIRYPAHYPSFRENLDRLRTNGNLVLGVSTALSVFNILDIVDILLVIEKYAQDNNFVWDDIILRIVHRPDYFSFEYLEKEHKEIAYKKIKDFLSTDRQILAKDRHLFRTLNEVCNLLLTEPDNFLEVVKERTRVLKLYDKSRNTDYKKLFPFIKDYE